MIELVRRSMLYAPKTVTVKTDKLARTHDAKDSL